MNDFQMDFFNKYIERYESEGRVEGLVNEIVTNEISKRGISGNKLRIRKVVEEAREVLYLINNYIEECKKLVRVSSELDR